VQLQSLYVEMNSAKEKKKRKANRMQPHKGKLSQASGETSLQDPHRRARLFRSLGNKEQT